MIATETPAVPRLLCNQYHGGNKDKTALHNWKISIQKPLHLLLKEVPLSNDILVYWSFS